MTHSADAPAYLPARMLNEFVYCPRLFYYEWVEGVFAHNCETVEGALRHAKLDAREDALTPAEELAPDDCLHSRSVSLSSDIHGLIAKIDLVEAADGVVTPVDYKRGAPRKNVDTGVLEAWDADRVQLAVQALVLRDNGYACREAIIYYVATKQRVWIAIDESLIAQTLQALADARAAAESEEIPPPLVDSPKCPRCSLVGICLPDETWACRVNVDGARHSAQRMLFDTGSPLAAAAGRDGETRRLMSARDDLRPLYLNTQGLYVGKSGNVLKVKQKDKVVQEVRIGETCQVNVFGNIQLSTQAIQTLCENEVPVAFFSMGGWFYGVMQGLGVRNIYLRREQFRLADVPAFCLRLARSLVIGKIKNQRTMLQRNHVEPPSGTIAFLKCMMDDAEHAESFDQLLGLEGIAARAYFERLPGMIKVDASDGSKDRAAPEFNFDFTRRNRRPPRDPVNALLSLAYSVLAKDLTIVCHAVGLDPYLGFYHQPRFGRAALALDLMEPFRPLIADSAVLSAVNTRMVTPRDFIRTGEAVALRPEGRKAFFRAYEQRMDTLVTHPLFGYRVTYRRLLEIQARLLARVLTGEISQYPVFVTR
ncbi:MAG: CRISPR-associated endonuclease Cas1 [Planctomycetia bacterium]|nr:CRISPR-associated endonuclease Cas1 [Planctomycetia bacterium]